MNTDASAVSLFPRTRWTLVARLQEPGSRENMHAWDDLCRAYRKPVMDYLTRHHRRAEEVEDLAQEFFCSLVHNNLLRDVNAARGRLRAWILMLLKRSLYDWWARAQAQKRGGHLEKVSLDEFHESLADPADERERDLMFDRQWALALLERVFTRLGEEHQKPAQQRTLAVLRPLLLHTPPGALKEAAASLAMEEGTVKVALHRLRQRFGGMLREEVSLTVAADADVDEELRYLLTSISAA